MDILMYLEQRASDFVKLWLIFAFVYFPMLTAMPLTIDAEWTTTAPNHHYWITQGRWFAYVLTTFILPPHLVPYFTLALFGLLACAAYLLVLKSCSLPLDWRTLLTFPIFCGFPIWSFIAEFPSNIAGAGVSLLLCALAALAIKSRRAENAAPGWLVAAEIAALTMAIGTYQAFVVVYPTMIIALLLINSSFANLKDRTGLALQAALILIAATLLNYAIQQLFYFGFGLLPGGYVAQFLRLDLFLDSPLWVLAKTAFQAANIYFGTPRVFGSFLIVGVVVVLGAIAGSRGSWVNLCLVGSLMSVPLGLAFASGGSGLPDRALLGVPVAIWTLSILALHDRGKAIRYVSIAAIALLTVQSVAVISQYQAVRNLVAEHDRSAAAQIYQRIASVADLTQVTKVDFFGGLPAPKPVFRTGRTSSAAGSFFSWDNGNAGRIAAYMKLLGYENLQLLPEAERGALAVRYKSMPSWPNAGSVVRDGDIVLVKLGEAMGYFP
jgi:hypothetical protein